MTCDDLKFKHVNHYGETQLMSRLGLNLKAWFDSGFLCIGAWTNITPPTPGAFGGDFSQLRLVHDPSYTDGTVYEGVRMDWAWESNVNYTDVDATPNNNPISPALIFVNASPTVPEFINYPLGRVHFSVPLASTDVVTASYSYRNVQVSIADTTEWWKELQYRSFRPDDTHFSQTNDGSWIVGGQHRVQMPHILIETVPRGIGRPAQLGDGSIWREQDVLIHVLAESKFERDKITDIIADQMDKNIWLFDNDAVALAGDFPLDYRGEIVDATKDYDALVDGVMGHRWERCRFIRTQISEVEALNTRLYEGVVRMTCEVFMHD